MFRSRKNDDVSRLTRQQKERVKQFVSSTGASERDAVAALQGSEWEVAPALARYQAGGAPMAARGGGGFLAAFTGRSHYHQQQQGGHAMAPQQPPVDPIQELFLRYKDPDSDMILVDGITRMCEDLEVRSCCTCLLPCCTCLLTMLHVPPHHAARASSPCCTCLLTMLHVPPHHAARASSPCCTCLLTMLHVPPHHAARASSPCCTCLLTMLHVPPHHAARASSPCCTCLLTMLHVPPHHAARASSPCCTCLLTMLHVPPHHAARASSPCCTCLLTMLHVPPHHAARASSPCCTCPPTAHRFSFPSAHLLSTSNMLSTSNTSIFNVPPCTHTLTIPFLTLPFTFSFSPCVPCHAIPSPMPLRRIGHTVWAARHQVEPQDIVMLVLSWHLGAATMCEYSRQEFTSGLRSLRVTSLEALKALLPSFRRELQDENVFRQIYNFAFAWAKEKGQKWLALDTAIGMWQLLLGYRSWPHVDHWCDFVRVQHNKAISKDTWSQLFEFSRVRCSCPCPSYSSPSLTLHLAAPAFPAPAPLLLTQGQLEQYDEGGAWPYLIDEFVDHLRAAGSLPSA
ncbi:unnamed protein product [Closterium sp. Naga37s-1]|nr:unnamed protein product [Closterium sp. Naga37s-1]